MTNRIWKWFLSLWLLAAMIVTIAPLIVVIILSLSKATYISLPKGGVTFHWWRDAITDSSYRHAAGVSLVLALISVAGSLVLGVPAAFALSRQQRRGGSFARILLSGPIIVPEILTALAILSFISYYNLGTGYRGLVIGHILITMPYVVALLAAAFTRTDLHQEWAAKSLGARAPGIFLRIIVPQVASEVMAASLFVFIVSWNNAGLSIFLGGTQVNTLPAVIFTDLQYSASPAVIAASAELVVLSVVVALILKKFFAFDTVLTRQRAR